MTDAHREEQDRAHAEDQERILERKRKGKAAVYMGSEPIDMKYIVPKWVSDDDVMHSKVPIFSTYRAEIQERGRLGIPKPIRQALGLSAGDAVDITIRLAKDPVEEGDQE